MSESPPAILEGALSVLAALEAESRPVLRVLIREDARFERPHSRAAQLARSAGVPVEIVGADAIDALAQGNTHGGIVAQVGDRRFAPLESLIPADEAAFLVMLDGVEDPYNFGGAVRAFYAAGAHGLVVRPRNWMSAAGVVARSSAGASERIPTAIAETTEAAVDTLRAHGLRIVVTDDKRAESIYDADLTAPLFVVIGGEKRGVTRSFADAADVRLRIPYGRDFRQSLGTTAAASIIAFEIMRQRVAHS